MWILDTDHLSFLEHAGNPVAERLRAKLLALPPGSYATTIVSYEEQCRGWLETISKQKSVLGQVAGYRRLHQQLQHYCGIQIVDFDEQAAMQFENLRASKVRIGTLDLKIASIALALDAMLLTRNTRDFSKVPGLRFEDWTKDETQP
jgi:tRNA(fMet)-specific endonuclease VapC